MQFDTARKITAQARRPECEQAYIYKAVNAAIKLAACRGLSSVVVAVPMLYTSVVNGLRGKGFGVVTSPENTCIRIHWPAKRSHVST